MSRDYVNEISVFNRRNVHIKDRDRLNKLLNKIIDGGVDSLQVVFDFDRTITKQHEEGKELLSSFGTTFRVANEADSHFELSAMFRHCRSITEEFVETEQRLRSIYFPIEISPSVSMAEKKKKMEEWYRESMQAFK